MGILECIISYYISFVFIQYTCTGLKYLEVGHDGGIAGIALLSKLIPPIFHQNLQSRCVTIAANQWMGSAWYLCQWCIGSGGDQPGQGCAVGCDSEKAPPHMALKQWRPGGPADFGDLQSQPDIQYIVPVVPHKAVAEVSKIGNL
jgi:hypothetical protein